MGENTPHIDSRYSPIYQRGGTASSGSAGIHRPVAQGSPPRKQPGPPDQAPVQPEPAEAANVVEVMAEDAAPGASGSAGLSLNPFVLVLWVLGAGMLALGLWAVFAPLQVDETALNAPYPQWIFIISQSAGGIVVAGSILVSAAGTLSALRWERKRHERQ